MIITSPELRDLDLPVYSEDTELSWSQDLFNANNCDAVTEGAQESPDTAIRPCTVVIDDISLANNGLMDILKRTDEELEVAAEMCGALVVGHEWGLYPVQNLSNNSYYSAFRPAPEELLPEDHILVAKVDVIRNTKNIVPPYLNIVEGTEHWYAHPEVYTRVSRGVANYNDSNRPHMHTDIRDDQFVVGACPKVTGNSNHIWLVDIDPLF